MRGLGLDFAQPRPGAPWWSWLLLLAGVGAAALAGMAYRQAEQAAAAAQAQLHALQLATRATPQRRRDPTREADAASRTLAQQALDRPWGAFLTALQQARPDDVALLALEADARRGQFSLTAEAPDYPAMIAYYGTLRDTAGLREVVLAQHSYREDGQARPVRFVLRGRWAEALAPEGKEK